MREKWYKDLVGRVKLASARRSTGDGGLARGQSQKFQRGLSRGASSFKMGSFKRKSSTQQVLPKAGAAAVETAEVWDPVEPEPMAAEP